MVLHTPAVKKVQFENIPQEMKEIPNWVLWKSIPNGDKKPRKVPYSIKKRYDEKNEEYNKSASATDNTNWLTFEEAREAYSNDNQCAGVFFALEDGHGIYSVDIDGTNTHKMLDQYRDRTYCEYSPNDGIHIYIKAEKPKSHASKPSAFPEVELYSTAHFISVTGDMCSEVNTVTYDDDTISYLVDTVFKKKEPTTPQNKEVSDKIGHSQLSQAEVIEKATSDSRRGEDIKLILNGEWEQATDRNGNSFPSQSESDFSLMSTLAFYSSGDSDMMYDIWSNSNAYRREKDHVNGGIGKTIENAVGSLSAVYDPNYKSDLNYSIKIDDEMLSGKELKEKLFKLRQEELLIMEKVWEENDKKGRKPSVISPLRTAFILRQELSFVLFDMEENTKLGMYLPSEGIYTQNTSLIKRIVSWLEPHHNERKAEETIYHIKNASNVKEKTNSKYLIPVENGVFNRQTKKLEPFNPDYVFTTKISTPYIENPEKPVIDGWDVDEWLNEIACGDEEIITLLWQVINDSMNGNYTRKKAIFLIGDGNNGKGTFQELLINLIGSFNVASLKVNEFDKPFRLSVLEGKTAVIGDDVPVNVYVDDSSNFNSVVTGDRVSVEFKNRQPYEAHFRCTVIQSTNGMPKFKNKTQGTLRRILIVPFNANFNGQKENPKIKEDYIQDEKVLQYILYKAINMDFERFITPKASLKELESFKQDNDPIYEFKVSVFDQWNVPKIPKYMVYGFYKHFCEENGYKPLSERKFHKEFKAHLSADWDSDSQGRFKWEDLIKYVGDLDKSDVNIEFPVPSKNFKAYENNRLEVVK